MLPSHCSKPGVPPCPPYNSSGGGGGGGGGGAPHASSPDSFIYVHSLPSTRAACHALYFSETLQSSNLALLREVAIFRTHTLPPPCMATYVPPFVPSASVTAVLGGTDIFYPQSPPVAADPAMSSPSTT